MSLFLLDTSALLAHFRNEAGAARVQAILEDEGAELLIAAVSVTELARRVAELGAGTMEARAVALEYAALADRVISVDAALSIRAFELGAASAKRIPFVDALIASAACLHDAILVHRDLHFGSIPMELLRQEFLE
ncbi:MAG: type II toxin-antitoxin system VapC family toxin [Rectinemataceae bacterium]